MEETHKRKKDGKKSKKLKKIKHEQPVSADPNGKATEAVHNQTSDARGDNSHKRKSDEPKEKKFKRKKQAHEQSALNNSDGNDGSLSKPEVESVANKSSGYHGYAGDDTLTHGKEKKKSSKMNKLGHEGKRSSLDRPVGEEVQYGAKAVADVLNEVNQNKGRPWTVSIALPGSILDNAQSLQLRTYLAGQIARAAVVFNVDEIIVFDESGYAAVDIITSSPIRKCQVQQGTKSKSNDHRAYRRVIPCCYADEIIAFDESGYAAVESTEGTFQGMGRKGNANVQLARILQYLECPQYLRKNFFPRHPDLQFAGVLNPLDCPHHMRAETPSPYREGVVVKKQLGAGKGSYVDVGKSKEVQIDKQLQPGLRVTVKMNQDEKTSEYKHCRVVSPSEPRTEGGIYWGYSVRLASSLGAVFTNCPYKDGYDLTIGTSERGDVVDDAELPEFRHLLVVFGGLQGLENSLEADEKLNISDPSLLFDQYLNTCPNQGSGTIRTEEAILVTMSILRPKILQAVS